jgi:hypothetical protein
MNYKSACLKSSTNNSNIAIKAKKASQTTTDENAKFNRSCARAMEILHLRWTKYKEDYIALHGQDEYERMYLTPNYWVMPEEEWEEEEEEDKKEEVDAGEYYSS